MDERELDEELFDDEELSLFDEVLLDEEDELGGNAAEDSGCEVFYTILQKNRRNLHRINAFLFRCQEYFEWKHGKLVRQAFLFGDNAGGGSTVTAALRSFQYEPPGTRIILDEQIRSSGILENLLLSYLTLREHCAAQDPHVPVIWMILMNREIPPALLAGAAWRQMTEEIGRWKADRLARYGAAPRIYVWQELSAEEPGRERPRFYELGAFAPLCDGIFCGEEGKRI